MPSQQFPAANIPGAALRFPSDQYATMENVPVFREHQTRAVDGRELKFGMQQLQMVCNRCNRRIAETGDYAAVVIGHTPDPENGDAPQPELVGYAGPFRMGTIGEGERKCWAILADFHIFRDDLNKVRKHPRRSPELCLEDTYEEMFLDPIALLGAEAPRLDLGLVTGGKETSIAEPQSPNPEPAGPSTLLYAFIRNGKRVEKYAMASCAMPAAGNVFAPSDKIAPPEKYAADQPALSPDNRPPTTPNPRTTSMLTPEDISAVVDAFLSTDAGQFLVQQMKEKQGTNAIVEPAQEPPAASAEPAAPAAPAAVATDLSGQEGSAQPAPANLPPPAPEPSPAPVVEKKPEQLPAANGEGGSGDGEEKAKKYAADCKYADDMGDEDLEKYLSKRWANKSKWKRYAAASVEGDDKTPAGDVVQETGDPQGSGAAPPAKTLPPTQLYSRLASDLQKVQGELAAERTKRTQVERYSRLQGLSAEFVMHPEDEMAITADMNEAQFERHCQKTIREHYQRNPVGLPWAAPAESMSVNREPTHPTNAPPSKETTEKQAAVAVERYQRRRHAGENVEFAEILEEVKAGK